MSTRLYFAYGSNLHPIRLRARVASAVVLGPAVLDGHALRFHKRGSDASGKCDAFCTMNAGDRVLGVVYGLEAGDVPSLHDVEGAGRGYDVGDVRVTVGGAVLEAFTYRAAADAVDPTLLPFDWYKALVLAGARYHRFDEAYVAAIERVQARRDLDSQRVAEHANLRAKCHPATRERRE